VHTVRVASGDTEGRKKLAQYITCCARRSLWRRWLISRKPELSCTARTCRREVQAQPKKKRVARALKGLHRTPTKGRHRTPTKGLHRTPTKGRHRTPTKGLHRTPTAVNTR